MIGRLGPHRVHPGEVFGRWTVVRFGTPEPRRVRRSSQNAILQHRVLVRCICARKMRLVWERDLLRGLSRGCESATCRNLHAVQQVESSASSSAAATGGA